MKKYFNKLTLEIIISIIGFIVSLGVDIIIVLMIIKFIKGVI